MQEEETLMQTSEIEIEHRDRVTHGEYRARTREGAAAKLTWTLREGVRVADHTFVPSELRGEGIAQQLVEAMVRDARREGFKIHPQCSYVVKKFDENPDWADVRG